MLRKLEGICGYLSGRFGEVVRCVESLTQVNVQRWAKVPQEYCLKPVTVDVS